MASPEGVNGSPLGGMPINPNQESVNLSPKSESSDSPSPDPAIKDALSASQGEKASKPSFERSTPSLVAPREEAIDEEKGEMRDLLKDIFMGTAFRRLKAAGLVTDSVITSTRGPMIGTHAPATSSAVEGQPESDLEIEKAEEAEDDDAGKSSLEALFDEALAHLWAALLAMDRRLDEVDTSRGIGSDWDRQQQSAKRQEILNDIHLELMQDRNEQRLADLMLTAVGLSMKIPAPMGTETSKSGVIDQIATLLNQLTDSILENAKTLQYLEDTQSDSIHHFRQSS